MTKKKLLLIVCALFLFTGCTATYELEIYDASFRENVSVIDQNPKTWDVVDPELGFSYRKRVMTYLNYPLLTSTDQMADENEWIRVNGLDYYETSLISTEQSLGLNWKYSFDSKNFSKSTILNSAYGYATLLETAEKTWILSTDGKLKYFDEYKELENVVIKIRTNHKVIRHNADQVDGTTYIWNISREQKNSRKIQVELSKEEKIFNYENEIIKNVGMIVGIVLGIAILGISVIIFFKWSKNRKNKI